MKDKQIQLTADIEIASSREDLNSSKNFPFLID